MGYGYYGRSPLDEAMEYIVPALAVIAGLIVLGIVLRVVKSVGGGSGRRTVNQGLVGMRGRTSEQKKVIKYFNSTGLLGAIFRISNAAFDEIMNNKVSECRSWINARALNVHGMDADEVREISPVLVEDYSFSSRCFKMFRDLTYRASGYQLSYLMFSEKQLYAYSYTFDLTCADTTERTREYFYEDITNVDVTHEKIEFPNPRPLRYILGGLGAIILGMILLASGSGVAALIGAVAIIAGVILAFFIGYTRSVVDSLTLRLTVPGDAFVCPIKPEHMSAVKGMKAKLREKKK